MKFLPILILIIQWSYSCDARVASSETDIVPNVNTNVKEREALHYPCTFRSLQAGDPYPSVVVKWQNQVQRLTWDSNGDVKFDRDYKQPAISFSYPSSGGLSGDGGVVTTVKPFVDAPVVPDNYAAQDIVEWFRRDCVRPY